MSEFTDKVRRNQIPGPNQRGFRRDDWISILRRPDLDNEDKRLASAGLFFDNLLNTLRSKKKRADLHVKPSAVVRILVALTTLNLFLISKSIRLAPPTVGDPPTLMTTSVLEYTIATATGQHFSPDEIITGFGDGMRYILQELGESKTTIGSLDEHELDNSHIDQINAELNIAIFYQYAVDLWFQCVGNSYGLREHEDGVALTSYAMDREVARTVSTYRRSNISLQDNMSLQEKWLYAWPASLKRKICEIPLVCGVSGAETIERIELGWNKKVLDAASAAIASKLLLECGYYKNLLDKPLSGLNNFTLNEVIKGWRLLQSLAVVLFDRLAPLKKKEVKCLLAFAPKIPKQVLCGTFAKAMRIEKKLAESLINVFLYRADRCSQEMWTQPLVSCGDDYCILISCIHSVRLERIVEGWMRQGGLDLAERGPEFEQFCREDLLLSLKDSAISDVVRIVHGSVSFRPPEEREEEIDIVLLFEETVLLVEAKCILWPDNSLQFANYRDTVQDAAEQILRKKAAVTRNYACFKNKIQELGYIAPVKPQIICCVLTNSAVFSGFPINGVPIVDLSILGNYFQNEHVKLEMRHAGKTCERHAIRFFNNKTEAGGVLEKYLLDPPQLSDTRKCVRPRTLVFPVESPVFGKLTYELLTVEMDTHIRERYGAT